MIFAMAALGYTAEGWFIATNATQTNKNPDIVSAIINTVSHIFEMMVIKIFSDLFIRPIHTPMCIVTLNMCQHN